MVDAPTLSRSGDAAGPGPSRRTPAQIGAEWRALFESLPEAVLILDPADGRVLAANAPACELYGYDHAGFIGRVLADVVAGVDRAPDYLRRAGRGEACRRAVGSHRRRDGALLQIEASAVMVEWTGRHAILAVHRDVTDRELNDERAQQARKMEAIGQLAGGVAHDFNNLLTVITGYADVLGSGLAPDDPMAEAVAEICAASSRAADLTRQLLVFSRKQVLRPQPVRLDRLVGNLRKMLDRLIGEDIRLVTIADPDLAAVRADPGQLEQVLINLTVNARDAMTKGGSLTIECRNYSPDDESARYVRLTVSDTGMGMTDEVKNRIFEPFFTTKGPGKGTGLGLSTVFGIVQQSGGRIGVESRVGVGTTFHIDLPLIVSVADPTPPPAARPTGLSRGSETILLVEDEGAVRMMALHALQASGYAVLDAEDGEQALRVVQTFGVPIRLLVTDVVLPGIGGRELADRLQTAQPWLRVLYVSGHTEEEIARRGVVVNQVHLLQKPFTPQEFCRRVREVLDGPASNADTFPKGANSAARPAAGSPA